MYSTAEALLEIEKQQCKSLSQISFGHPVRYIYNPLDYAKETHECFVRVYCTGPKTVLFLGMNPGPFGMAQNGVPFGDTEFVKNWLNISGYVSKPEVEHPKRPIEGLNCARSETSGRRFWSFMKQTCHQPEKLFQHCYVHNYCPISMMMESAKNITPADLKANEKKALMQICDEALFKVITLLRVKYIVSIGKFAETRAKTVLQTHNIPEVGVIGILHPSPINPVANKGWDGVVHSKLTETGIMQYLL